MQPQSTSNYTVFCWPFFPIKDLWMWGITPGNSQNSTHLTWFKYTILLAICMRITTLTIIAEKRLLTSTSNSGLDQRIQLFVSPDGQLQVAWGYALHLKIFRRISSQFQHLEHSHRLGTRTSDRCPAEGREARERYLCGEILEDGRAVDRRRGSHSAVAGGSGLEMSVNTPHWELKRQPGGKGFYSNGYGAVIPATTTHFHRSCCSAGGNEKASAQTCSPALCEREIAFVLVFPESLPALPAAWKTHLSWIYTGRNRIPLQTWNVPPVTALFGY